MATSMARGKSGKKGDGKSKSKHKMKKENQDSKHDGLEALMTEEDKELLQSVNDADDEHVEDVQGTDGNDIDTSEIASFIKQLGITQYHSFQLTSETGKDQDEKEPDEVTVSPAKKDKMSQKTNKILPELMMKEGENGLDLKKKKMSKELQEKNLKDVKKTEKDKKKSSAAMPDGIPDKDLSPTLMEDSKVIPKKRETDPQALNAALSYLKSYKSRKYLLVKPGESWKDEEARTLAKEPADSKLVNEAETLATRLLADELALYTKQRESTKRSEAQWLKTVLSTGTLTDKMAALTLLVQESPLHNLSGIDTLIGMASKKGRREVLMAIDTLRDLFLTGLLPDNRKLRAFNLQPLLELGKISSGNVEKRDKLLLYWHFENLLKKKYAQFIKILGELSFDTLPSTKEKAMSTVYHLLSSKPEQEQVLLPMLVNKLGDQNIKSKASHWLAKLVEDHPNMKGVIVREIRHLLYRPNVSQRAQYYAICYLTQLRLSQDESDLATQLIQIYFSFFQSFLRKGEMDSKMLSALLTGVNRAFVYASEKKDEILSSMEEVYKIIPSVNFQTSVQALMLLFHVTDSSSSVSDRFYTTLYRRLADPALRSSSKQAVFLSLLFKSLKRDLMNKRVIAFVKRILQVYSQHPPHVICGVLILLSQIIKEKPGLLNMTRKAQVAWVAEDDDDEEKFVDLPVPDEFLVETPELEEKDKEQPMEENEDENMTPTSKSSWIHRTNKSGRGADNAYNPHHRNPLYSKAEEDCVWELEELAKHFHPSVSLYANMLLKGELIEYDGDPLNDFTLIRFLDRFVYKNPKKINNMTNAGAPQRRSSMKERPMAVNSQEFLDQEESQVAENDKFFYKYFLERSKKKKEKEDESDDESVSDAEFDSYLDKYGDAVNDDLGNLDMDFAGDKSRSKKGNKKDQESESESDEGDEEDDDDDLDLGDDALAAEFEKELEGLEDEDDDEDMEDVTMDGGERDEEEFDFEANEDDPLSMMMKMPSSNKAKKKRKQSDDFSISPSKKSKKKKLDSADLFASAEEFAHLLEEDVEGGHVSAGGSNQMLNQDKAAKKQMVWEQKRDQWLSDGNHQQKKKWRGKGKRSGNKKSASGPRKPGKFGKSGKRR